MRSESSLASWSRVLAALALMLLLSTGASRPAGQNAAQGQGLAAETRFYLPVVLKYTATLPDKPTDGIASWASPVAVSPLDGTIWVVNPDSGSVTVVDGKTWEKQVEIPVGQEPWSLAVAPDGQLVYVTDRATGTLIVIDAHTHLVRRVIPLGPEPGGIALTPTGRTAYITLTTADEVVVVDTIHLSISARIPVQANPYAIAVSDDGDTADDDEQVYVTHLLAFPQPGSVPGTDDGQEGHVSVIETATNLVSRTIRLMPDEHGFPNLLSHIAIAGNQAWIPQVRAAPALPRGLTTTVFAAVSVLDLLHGAENTQADLPLNDQEIFGSPVNNPIATVPSADNRRLYIVLAGSDLVEVVDISEPEQPRLVKFLPVGKNPRGMAISRDGQFGYVMSYLSRSLSVLDLEKLARVAEIPLTAEALAPDVLTGKILFNNAANPRLSQGSWISCASCHPEGGTDGVTWMFPDGPRQSPALWNAAVTRPWHWSAALDEYQDVEETIQLIQHGLGLAAGEDPAQLGSLNAGRSAELDALAAFMVQGIRPPVLTPASGDLTPGRDLFQSAGCASCHGGANWTISALPGAAGTLDPDGNGMIDEVLREVGTLNLDDVRGQTGFDVPTLVNVSLTAPYLHDGSMPTLEALLASGHPDPQGDGNGLDEFDIGALINFLTMISVESTPIEE